jgi:hypothetical protein
MRVTFTFDPDAMLRPRYIALVQPKKKIYEVKPDPIYNPIHTFITAHTTQGYPFRLVRLMHATGVKMLGLPCSNRGVLKRSFQATGGLYLALDIGHPDLAIRQSFGDFTAGFSHQFGVGIAVMSASQAYSIPWDALIAKRVGRNPTLDYQAPLAGDNWLEMEAKGVTSSASGNQARRDIYKKKQANRQQSQANPVSTPGSQTAMLGFIVQAVRRDRASVGDIVRRKTREPDQAMIEIIDPVGQHEEPAKRELYQKAGQYWHYAGAAIFAGLYDVARELIARAEALRQGKPRKPELRHLRFQERATLPIARRNIVGIQWRPSDRAELPDDVWFYQAIDREVIRAILVDDAFPKVRPYHYDSPDSLHHANNYVESIFPDGSYFGIGTTRRDALRPLSPNDIHIKDLRY